MYSTDLNQIKMTTVSPSSSCPVVKCDRFSKKILVVDNSLDSRKLLRSILQYEGFTVLDADVGINVLRFIESRKDIAAILLGLDIPDGDGRFVIREIKHLKRQNGLKICVASCSSDEASIRSFLDQGADDYLIKGVDHNILVHKLKKLLGLQPTDNCHFSRAFSYVRASVEYFDESLPVMITQISAVEIKLESKIILPQDLNVAVKCSYLNDVFGVENFNLHLRIGKSTKRNARYLVDCEIVGLPDGLIDKLKALVSGRRYITDFPATIH